ncbi:MAG: MBL fold metallo-hydrolase [Proteobacteria bacterium]|nr:MBL fold metallo-hydrolase [Pseudomonadota bacterium]
MAEHGAIVVETLTNGPFAENCYLVACARTRAALIVDPGDEAERIAARVAALGLEVQRIVATHAHIDHVGAVAALQRHFAVPFAIHAAERTWLQQLALQASVFRLPSPEVPSVDEELVAGTALTFGDQRAEVLATPGHTPGGCSLHLASAGLVFVGDTLFAGSIGRTDLPGGDLPTLMRSLRERLLTLEDSTIVFSGHGPTTTIGAERQHNPFIRGSVGR